jgi:hypothetical protein
MLAIPVDGADYASVFVGPWDGSRKPDYWSHLSSIAAGKTIIIAWSGNIHNAAFLLEPDTPFDFYLQSRPDLQLDPTSLIVPVKILEEKLQPGINGLAETIAMIAGGGPARLIVMHTPPPREDLSRQAGVASSSEFWRNAMMRMGMDPDAPRFTRSTVRLKLWTLLMEMTSRAARDAGAEVMNVPRQALDPLGFLRGDLGAGDLTHAGRAYGDIVITQLQSILTEREAS